MTPDEIKWLPGDNRQIEAGGAPVGPGWLYAIFRTPEGDKAIVHYYVPDLHPTPILAEETFCGFCIECPTRNGYASGNPFHILWEGDSMLGLMCAIEALQLTPEVT